MEIKKTPNDYYPELSSFLFQKGDKMLCIYLSEDRSLNFTITNKDEMYTHEEFNEFQISKNDIEVYNIFKELIDDFEKLSPVYEKTKELLDDFDDYITNGPYSQNKKAYNKNLLFKPYKEPDLIRDRCITWQSDDSYFYEMNTLRIRENSRGILISIKTAIDTDVALGRNVKIQNVYSHQNPYSFLFMSFYYKLQRVDSTYHQEIIFEN